VGGGCSPSPKSVILTLISPSSSEKKGPSGSSNLRRMQSTLREAACEGGRLATYWSHAVAVAMTHLGALLCLPCWLAGSLHNSNPLGGPLSSQPTSSTVLRLRLLLLLLALSGFGIGRMTTTQQQAGNAALRRRQTVNACVHAFIRRTVHFLKCDN
jgi:hypothetical protein